MSKWEYEHWYGADEYSYKVLESLNKWGSKGWEIIAAEVGNRGCFSVTALMKREVSE